MKREKLLIKNTAILTVGKICTQLITFFLLPIYTGILSTEEYGTVDLLNTLISLLLPIITFQVEQALFRNLIEVRDNEEEKKKVISTGLISVVLQCVVYIIIFCIISPFINNRYKIFLASNVIAYIFASLFQQIARGLGDNKQYAIASFFSALVTILSNILFLVVIKFRVNGMLLGTMIGQFTCVIYLFLSLKIYKYINVKDFEFEILKKMWKYSIPLIPNAISWWVFNASDRVIVSTVLGVGQNGILSAAHKFPSIYITLYNIFYMSWNEFISLHINDEDIEQFFNKIFNQMLKIFITISIGMIVCMPFIYGIMINEKFQDGYYQIPIMLIGSIFNVIVGLLSVVYVAKKNTKAIANTSIISAIINIVVNILLIKNIGLYAATISTFIAYFVMSIYRIHDVNKKYFKIHIDKGIIIKSTLILIIIIPTYYMKNYLLCLLMLLITIIYAYIFNKDSLNLIIKMLKNKFKYQLGE